MYKVVKSEQLCEKWKWKLWQIMKSESEQLREGIQGLGLGCQCCEKWKWKVVTIGKWTIIKSESGSDICSKKIT